MQTGTIKRKMDGKNFGFIETTDGDVFFHANGLSEGLSFDGLEIGDAVTFDVESTPKGNAAINIKKAE